MGPIVATGKTVVGELGQAWTESQPARLAAALAYYGMFSLAPMLYIALSVAGIFINELAVVDDIFSRLSRTLGAETAEFLREMVIAASQRTSRDSLLTSLISLGALLYAATGLFANLKYSLNTIWQVPPASQAGLGHLVKTRLLAFALVLGIALLLVVVALLSIVLSVLTSFFDFGSSTLAGNIVSFILLIGFSFAVLYRILPDAEVSWRSVWPGAILAALLVAAGRWGLGIYLRYSSVSTAFQAAGTLAVILIVIYYFAQIFLFGALVTRVYQTRRTSGDRATTVLDQAPPT
jgi:membrane protein